MLTEPLIAPTATRRELLLGCGARRDKIVALPGAEGWSGLVTLDRNDAHGADVVHDLERVPYPFPSDHFDEVHAYEVLEHLGGQGDFLAFFAQFSELHRILKPGGMLHASVPRHDSIWAWGDPSHRRIINEGTLAFLSQKAYAEKVGRSPMSDFRDVYKADFETVYLRKEAESLFFVLRAIKADTGHAPGGIS